VKLFDKRFRLIIGVGIKELMGMTVLTEKTLEPEHIAVFGAADNDRPAGSNFKQADAAENQRTHDPFTKLGFGSQKRAQPLRPYNESLDRLQCPLCARNGSRRPLFTTAMWVKLFTKISAKERARGHFRFGG
jgi:hypothetical protein